MFENDPVYFVIAAQTIRHEDISQSREVTRLDTTAMGGLPAASLTSTMLGLCLDFLTSGDGRGSLGVGREACGYLGDISFWQSTTLTLCLTQETPSVLGSQFPHLHCERSHHMPPQSPSGSPSPRLRASDFCPPQAPEGSSLKQMEISSNLRRFHLGFRLPCSICYCCPQMPQSVQKPRQGGRGTPPPQEDWKAGASLPGTHGWRGAMLEGWQER